jgi:hypothetical protein
VNLEHFIYYAGYAAAIFLSWGLGRLFAVPTVLNLAFDLCVSILDFPGWIFRWIMVTYGLAMFVWVLALAGVFTRSMFVALTCLEVTVVVSKLWAPIQVAGVGSDFWTGICTTIYDIWLVSIFVAVASVAMKSSIIAKLRGKRVDLLTNPRKRFILPIGIWAAIIVIPGYLSAYVPDTLLDNRYKIAAQALVWGWVAFELPSYITHKRLMRKYCD